MDNFPEAHHFKNGNYRLSVEQMNRKQAINGDLYLPLYELMDPTFTSALSLTFELTGESLCQLYVQQQDVISKLTDREGISFVQTKDTIRVGIFPSKLNPNLKAGAKILMYIPRGTSVLLKEGSRKVNRVSDKVDRMSLFSLDTDVADEMPDFGMGFGNQQSVTSGSSLCARYKGFGCP